VGKQILSLETMSKWTVSAVRLFGVGPSLVFTLVDNVGWGDFGVYGGTTPAPRIDKLSSEAKR
jgi:hypothetical protein